MLELKTNVIQKIEIEALDEAQMKKVLISAIESQLPAGAQVNSVEFVTKRNPMRVELEIDAQFGGAVAVTKAEPVEDEAPFDTEEAEVSLTRDGVADIKPEFEDKGAVASEFDIFKSNV